LRHDRIGKRYPVEYRRFVKRTDPKENTVVLIDDFVYGLGETPMMLATNKKLKGKEAVSILRPDRRRRSLYNTA
jgi:hypothetical protein